MGILQEIIAHKRKEVDANQALYPVKLLEKSTYFDAKPVSLVHYLRRADKNGIIAEFKRKSPSKGWINPHAQVERTSIGYMQAGASGLSIITDKQYFGGSADDLKIARQYNFCPILRKDFMIDEYQIIESKSIGADVILLIASALTPAQTKALGSLAKSLGMEVLLEVHDESELNTHFNEFVDLLGVNNRNLSTFVTSVEVSKNLAAKIPSGVVKIAESGLDNPAVVNELRTYGFDGFLIGEHFMRHGRPEKAIQEFAAGLKETMQTS